ncbi:uncharacterized protein L203_104709 [Cryptococcus depauperatus CBS 7841]|uniref:Nucleoside diphosphate kinase n=1 Tax=Cryptococcus depauperatus CBS 7841 TaxID=1295531 RepID=A0AAJ8JW64_9TREE
MDYPKLLAVKSLAYSPALAKEYYADLAARPFYGGLVKYMTSGTPVVAMVWEGKDIIRQSVCLRVGAGANNERILDGFDSATKEIGPGSANRNSAAVRFVYRNILLPHRWLTMCYLIACCLGALMSFTAMYTDISYSIESWLTARGLDSTALICIENCYSQQCLRPGECLHQKHDSLPKSRSLGESMIEVLGSRLGDSSLCLVNLQRKQPTDDGNHKFKE